MPELLDVSPDEIKAFREELGLTQADLGQKLGGSKRSVEDWEAGRRQAPAMLRLAMAAVARGATPWSPSRVLTAKATMDDVDTEIRRHITSLATDLEYDLQHRFADNLPADASPAEAMLFAQTLGMNDGYNTVYPVAKLSEAPQSGFSVWVAVRAEFAGGVAALGFESREGKSVRRLAVFIDTHRRGERLPAKVSLEAALIAQGVRVFSLSEAEVLSDPEDCRERIETLLTEMAEECLHESGHIEKPWVRPDRR